MLLSDENRTFLRFCAKIKGQGEVYKPDLKNGIRFGILDSYFRGGNLGLKFPIF